MYLGMNIAKKGTMETKNTIYREDAIEAVYKLVEELPPKSILSKEPNKIYPSDVVKALSALPSAEVVSRELYEKRVQADERIIDSYRREFAEAASVEAMNCNYKGLCAVCADKQVCKDAKRSLDMIECSRFELDTRYHVSTDAVLQLNLIDTLIIANALRYLINDEERHELDRATAESLRERVLKYGASMCKGDNDE